MEVPEGWDLPPLKTALLCRNPYKDWQHNIDFWLFQNHKWIGENYYKLCSSSFFFLESYHWTTLLYHYKHSYKYMILPFLFLYQMWMGKNTELLCTAEYSRPLCAPEFLPHKQLNDRHWKLWKSRIYSINKHLMSGIVLWSWELNEKKLNTC